ncbi:RICIN domain-containing protein, partial [Lentzea sp. CC55]|uniref:RICIN domain-containing protein n=1 Tax=Lentzea sp. CC55 TaxID=2884909 RepID=UPI001F17D5F0
MKLSKIVLSAVFAVATLTSLGTSTAVAADEAPTTFGEAVQNAEKQLRAGAAVADSDWFYLRSLGRGGYCLDNFASGGGANNSKVGLWTCNGGVTERWRLRLWNSGMFYGYNLVNEASGRCLDYPASAGD